MKYIGAPASEAIVSRLTDSRRSATIFESSCQTLLTAGPDAPERDDYPLRVARGGAWDGLDGAGTPEGLRSARRYAFAPWTRSFRVGLRCAADWNPPQEIFPAFGGAQ